LELTRFLASLAAGKKKLTENHDPGSILAAAEEQLVKPDVLKALEGRLRRIQVEVGRRTRSGQGRHWEMPNRQAASHKPGTLTRDDLVWNLQGSGLDFREARKVVDAIFKSMTQSLRRGEEVIVPPLGTFTVRGQPKTTRRLRQGRLQTLFRQARKVVFRASDVLRLHLADWRRWIQPEVKVPNEKQHLQCPECGSTDFLEGQFRKYYKLPSSLPGGDLAVASERAPMPALVCLCGEPVPLGHLRRQVPGDRASFQKSMAAAQRYREEVEPEKIIETLAGSFARKQEMKDLAERLAKMEAVVEAIPKAGNKKK
jgi:nucleoid DNA-binding protein